jgi:hypothetical protein
MRLGMREVFSAGVGKPRCTTGRMPAATTKPKKILLLRIVLKVKQHASHVICIFHAAVIDRFQLAQVWPKLGNKTLMRIHRIVA